eukprot:12919219-Alexandrium_andersonii.AAC.1
MMVLSMAHTVGIPRGCETILREISLLKAPWHSVVIGDRALGCIEAKSRPDYPTYKYVTSMITEVLGNEPSVCVEWGGQSVEADPECD